MNTGKPFYGGVPWSVDVQKLEREFGVPEKGRMFLHEELERVIGLDRRTSRYKAVVRTWRKLLLGDHNLDSIAILGEGIKILPEPGRVLNAESFLRAGTRKIANGKVRIDGVDPVQLDEKTRAKADHLQITMAKLRGIAREGLKMLPPRSVAESR